LSFFFFIFSGELYFIGELDTKSIFVVEGINYELIVTHCRPAMPFGNRKKNILEDLLVQYCQNLKNITPLEI